MPAETITADPRFPTVEQVYGQILADCGGDSDLAAKKAWEWKQQREEGIAKAANDPLRYGYEPPTYAEARASFEECLEVWLSGANREGKTTLAVKYGMEILVNKPGSKVAFFEANETASILKIQPMVYNFLPPEWKSIRKKDGADMSYTPKNGFSQGRFVLPNGSIGMFFNYAQDIKQFEGFDFDVAIFFEHCPLQFIEAMRFRVGQGRKLLIINDFTPVNGFTPIVKDLLKGMEIISTAEAKLLPPNQVHVKGCPPGHMPTLMEDKLTKRRAHFFHIGTNPMGVGEGVKQKLIGRSVADIKMRAYGWADKTVTGSFARYGKSNVISRAAFNEIALHGGRRTCVIDGGDAKNWFITYIFSTPNGDDIAYREWPDYEQHGDWALPTEKVDWKPGKAQMSTMGRGYSQYKALMLELEGAVWDDQRKEWDMRKAEQIETRIIDSRFGGKPVPGQDEGTTVIAQMGETQIDEQGRVMGPMELQQASGTTVRDGIQHLNDLLAWDETQPLSGMNRPKFYIVEDLVTCKLALQEWTGANSEKCALKDPLDTLLYFAKESIEYLDPAECLNHPGGYF